MDPVAAFRNEIETFGLLPSELAPDGILRRCPTQDKPRDKSGWCVLYGNPPAGAFGNWRTGESRTWSSNGGEIGPETRRRIQERIREAKAQREAEQENSYSKAAQEAQRILSSLPDASPENTYLVRKGVAPCALGLKADGTALLVPVYGPDGRVMSMQTIEADGAKKNMPGGKMAGGYFPINKGGTGRLIVCEGPATGLTLHEADPTATVLVAFSAGNLEAVSRMARKYYPTREIILAADNDAKTEAKTAKNPGREAAEEAARAVSGKVALPVFDGEAGTDLNDLHQVEGIEAVKRCLDAAKDLEPAEAEDPWPVPVSFDSVETPPIDPGMIPSPLREFSEAVAVSVQVPLELPVMGVLGAIATATQGKFKVQVRPGYFEHLCVYSLTVLPPGERKSASLDACKRPLVDWETEQYQLLEPEIRRARSELMTRQKAIDKARGKAPSDPEKLRDTIQQVQALEETLPVVPVAPRLLGDDITPEELACFMAEHDERASVIEAEGGLFSILAGMYSSGTPNLNLVLKSWSAEATTVDRRSRDTIRLKAPALSLTFTPQPEVLRDIAGMPGFRGRGLLGRFLYCLPSSRLGTRTIETVPMSEGVQAGYRAMLFRILNKPWAQDDHGNHIAYQIRLSGPAYRLWVQFAEAVEVELREGGHFEPMRDWAGKLPGQAIRLAGLYHVASEEDPPSVPIPEDTMSMALSLAAVLADHAKVAFNFMGSDPAVECSRKILRWIIQGHIEAFTARDSYQAVKGSYPKMEQVSPGLKMLEDREYIRQADSDKRSGPGRKASPVFKVNPYALNTHNSHNRGS